MITFVQTHEMSSESQVNELQERIKELSCLYDLASLSMDESKSLSEVLQTVVERIPLAWCFPEDARCVLEVGEVTFASSSIASPVVELTQEVVLQHQKPGMLRIQYPSPRYSMEHFLPEEVNLLKKLATEIGLIIDRRQSSEREQKYLATLARQDRLKVLEEITAGIAHELNTPLGNIFGFAQLILDSERDSQTLSDAQKILNSAVHAREIVKKLMYFSCELPQRFDFISVRDLILETLQLLAPMVQKSGVRIELNIPDDLPPVQADPVQLTQVIFNLLINAIHASADNDQITILVKLTRADRLRLCIKDEGTGMTPEVCARIFEPFYTTRSVGGGTGLGLSVVHGIVRAHNGSITVQSEPGEGSSFTIELPLKQDV